MRTLAPKKCLTHFSKTRQKRLIGSCPKLSCTAKSKSSLRDQYSSALSSWSTSRSADLIVIDLPFSKSIIFPVSPAWALRATTSSSAPITMPSSMTVIFWFLKKSSPIRTSNGCASSPKICLIKIWASRDINKGGTSTPSPLKRLI